MHPALFIKIFTKKPILIVPLLSKKDLFLQQNNKDFFVKNMIQEQTHLQANFNSFVAHKKIKQSIIRLQRHKKRCLYIFILKCIFLPVFEN